MSGIAVNIRNISKIYPLYNDPVDRLKEALHPLRKKYHQEFFALKNISCTINKGETVGIIGKNGSGKSTLLKILTGVLTPTTGTCQVHGRVLALLELGAGFNPELTGIENIYFNGSLLGASKEEMDSRLERILNFADIGEFVYQPVKTYSSGMAVRLAFAVIANMDADILIIDEALSVGDAFFVQKCMKFLRKFKENGTLLFVSHDTSAVLSLCSRAIWLDKGIQKADDTPKAIAESYLASLFGSNDSQQDSRAGTQDKPSSPARPEYRDMRQDFINTTRFRNDIKIFSFNDNGEAFGRKGAEITSAALKDPDGRILTWVIGGENVELVITCTCFQDIYSPIVGFYVKDRLGQILFGDNTCNFTQSSPLDSKAGDTLCAVFHFTMPTLPVGDYSFTVAVAEGTQENHIQHHWIHDAFIIRSQTTSVSTGLIGIPIHNIKLDIQ